MPYSDNKIKTDEPIIPYTEPLSHSLLYSYINEFAQRYSCFHVTSLGTSITGKTIPMITLGKGEKCVMYIGAHHGMEWITSALLMKFANEYCELLYSNGRVGHTRISYLNATRTICIVPMLNPDGVEYQINGISKDNPLYERVMAMNASSPDFSAWQANARGVDLNHNYNAGFEEYKRLEQTRERAGGSPTKWCGECPESEPESGFLANYVRFNEKIKMFLSFHSQGEEIYYGDAYNPPKENIRIGNILSSMSGYKLSKTEGSASFGGFTDWVVKETGKPCYTIECGRGENPLPIKDLFGIYYKLRRMLFEAPMVI